MQTKSRRGGLAAATFCVGLLGCVSSPPKQAEAPPVAPPRAEAVAPPPAPEPPPPPPKIATPAEQQEAQKIALKVAEILEAGKTEEAQVEIEHALAVDPANKLANSFLKQLTVDPQTELGSEAFSYTIKPGETLSRIAGRFMGDIFQFYILARYNGISTPRLVPAGQVIRVPGKAPPPEDRREKIAKPEPKPEPKPAEAKPVPKLAEPKVETRPEPVAAEVKPSVPGPAEPKKVEKPVEAAVAPPKRAEPESPLPAVAKPKAEEPSRTPPVDTALVRPAAEMPKPPAAQVPMVPPPPTPADLAFQRGLREQANGNNLQAYEAFKQAYGLDPSNREARSNADMMRQEIVADYTRKARAAFAKQDLQGSINQWDLLLKFDPDNDLAQLERQKALALQERIRSIK